MSLENAQENLVEFGKELGLDGLQFDENNTCILGIDDQFSMHLTYEPNSDRLFVYSPLLDGFPDNKDHLLKLYERLLEGSMLGGQMAGGGCGIAIKEQLVLMHSTLDMAHAYPSALRAFAPLYVDSVEAWRKICKDLAEGREPTDVPPGPNVRGDDPAGGKKGSKPKSSSPGRSDEGFIKI